ncbi:MAG: hypothetical protein Ct9H300mP25_15760 [Acidobacteriota bacterium]|nr:MAG: hypothetical protein Ct9H300mP25_15760 [Acidobacteriota bacterium]
MPGEDHCCSHGSASVELVHASSTFAVVALCASVVLGAREDTSPVDDRDLPLDPERTFLLDTDEGTWISVDVSPDGETVVFDLLGTCTRCL